MLGAVGVKRLPEKTTTTLYILGRTKESRNYLKSKEQGFVIAKYLFKLLSLVMTHLQQMQIEGCPARTVAPADRQDHASRLGQMRDSGTPYPS